jgi:hypothetical protein
MYAHNEQSGSNQLVGRISTEKRASVYRTDQLSDGLKLAGNGIVGSLVAAHHWLNTFAVPTIM